MPRNKKKAAIVISPTKCRIKDVVEAIIYQIETKWMTEEDFDSIYKQVKTQIKRK